MMINCFGDSLTAGTAFGNTTPYPGLLSQMTGFKVNNYGIGGEDSHTIAIRIGAHKLYVKNDCSIANGITRIEPIDEDGNEVNLLKQVQEDTGLDMLNPVTIGDIEGRLVRDEEGFLFETASSEALIKAGTPIRTMLSAKKYDGDINIFWAGTNDRTGLYNVEQVISNIKDMIAYTGSSSYVVIGLTALEYMPQVAAVNERLFNSFGGHFYDFRSFLLGLDVTDEEDKADIAKGDVPVSLIKAPQYDHVHGNEKFFFLLATELKKKLLELSYL